MNMSEETLFTKIINKEIPADFLFQDDRVTAFRDIHPQAPTHILIVPTKPIPTINDVTEKDEADLGHLFVVAAKLAEQEGIATDGYRVIMNCGNHGGQEVSHLHMHLVGGRPLGRMISRTD
jgi:histidine triad (HIT) family protein